MNDQARAVAEDVPVQVIKVGFVGTPENLATIAARLREGLEATNEPMANWGNGDAAKAIAGAARKACK